MLREKITHFDHERIPERVVHARGSGRMVIFRSMNRWRVHEGRVSSGSFSKNAGVRALFDSQGSRGSTDLARDVRGFAVKFYTQEGNFDLVGNNIPVFFIQDAIKFPDLVHAVKPEPHHEMPQAASAHDTSGTSFR
jgi:catalase